MTDNQLELLKLINENENPEQAVITVSKILNYFLEHPDIYDKPHEEQMQMLENFA